MWIKPTIFDGRKVKHISPKQNKYVLIEVSYTRTLVKIITKFFVDFSSSDQISRNYACQEAKKIFHDSCLVSRRRKLKHVQKYAQKGKSQQQQTIVLVA
jgi:hypothetical protein